MQSPSKLSVVSLPGLPAFSGPQCWADLPEGLLHSIVARLGPFRDLLGFAATCPSWRAAFSSHPSKSTFCTKFPPLLTQPHVLAEAPVIPSTNGCHELYTCKAIDPANQNTALRCQIPQETPEMIFIGSSYGNLIYCCDGYCRIVDVFTGVVVSTPHFPSSVKYVKPFLNGILTAPLASPNSHLLVSTDCSLFDLPVGSDSWSELQLPRGMEIEQIVEFNSQIIVWDGYRRFHSLQLAPHLGLQEITTKFHDTIEHPPDEGWLLVRGDMLLMHSGGMLYRLDKSRKPATWMAMEKLDNWTLFVGEEAKSAPVSCMTPELWGGRSNMEYSTGKSIIPVPWLLMGLCGEPHPMQDIPDEEDIRSTPVESTPPLWLYPSMSYSDGQ